MASIAEKATPVRCASSSIESVRLMRQYRRNEPLIVLSPSEVFLEQDAAIPAKGKTVSARSEESGFPVLNSGD